MTYLAKFLILSLLLLGLSASAQTSSYADYEARQEIINLRPQVENLRRSLAAVTEELRKSEEARRNADMQQSQSEAKQQEAAKLMSSAMAKYADDQAQLRRGLLELTNQLEFLRREFSQMRGENEQIIHYVAGVQRGLQDMKKDQADLKMRLDNVRSSSGETQGNGNNLEEIRRELKANGARVDTALQLVRDALNKVGSETEDRTNKRPQR